MKPIRFGLIVTCKGEREFLPDFFRALCKPGAEGQLAVLQTIRHVGQRSEIASKKRIAERVGKKKAMPTKDEEIGLAARSFLQAHESSFVVLIDDLEHDRRARIDEIRQRYRTALDTVLANWAHRASVHFFVPMIEAYYFADAASINAVLGLSLDDYNGDVEQMRHPKEELKELCSADREIEHGKQIAWIISLEHVLAHPDRCAHLRSLVKWCIQSLGFEVDDRFQLQAGRTA